MGEFGTLAPGKKARHLFVDKLIVANDKYYGVGGGHLWPGAECTESFAWMQ